LSPDERAALLDQLQSGKASLASELEGLSDSQARFRSGSGAWSILDCVEHIALAESAMFIMISRKSYPAERGESREQAYLANSVKRGRKFEAPGLMRPAGRHLSVAAAFEAFADRRNRTIHYIETVEDDLRGRRTAHPVAGDINCRECLALLIGHPLRHMEQIREIKAAPGFPD